MTCLRLLKTVCDSKLLTFDSVSIPLPHDRGTVESFSFPHTDQDRDFARPQLQHLCTSFDHWSRLIREFAEVLGRSIKADCQSASRRNKRSRGRRRLKSLPAPVMLTCCLEHCMQKQSSTTMASVTVQYSALLSKVTCLC